MAMPKVPTGFITLLLSSRDLRARRSHVAESLVQQRIELDPDVVFLGAGPVAVGAFVVCHGFGSWSFGLMMIEVEISPAAGVGKPLGILDGHVGAVERSGEIAAPRALDPRAIGLLPG